MASRPIRNHLKLKLRHLCNATVVKRNQSHANVNSAVDTHKDAKRKLPTLFVPARYGGDVYQIVKPFLNAEFVLDNITEIKRSCDLRGIEFDCEYAVNIIKEWSCVKSVYSDFVKQDKEHATEFERQKSLGQIENYSREKKESFLNELKTAKYKYHDIDDIAMPIFHRIPNVLDANVPTESNRIEFSLEPPSAFPVISHLEVGKHLSLLEFSSVSPTAYFLLEKLAELDFAAQLYFSEKFRSSDFAAFSCMDFCKSFIIEAIGFDPHSSDDCINLKDSRDASQKLNLVGGASLESFCAYLTNMNADLTSMPLKYFSSGRRYNAKNRNATFQNLFSVVQSNNIHHLVLCHPSTERDEFDSLCHLIFTCYSDLKLPFRMVELSADNLTVTESRRKQFEMFSPVTKKYLPIAHVSQHNDFLSKRLHITYGTQHVVDGFSSIVEGVAVNTSTLIGCIMENLQTQNHDFEIPVVLNEYMSSFMS